MLAVDLEEGIEFFMQARREIRSVIFHSRYCVTVRRDDNRRVGYRISRRRVRAVSCGGHYSPLLNSRPSAGPVSSKCRSRKDSGSKVSSHYSAVNPTCKTIWLEPTFSPAGSEKLQGTGA